MWIMPSWSDTHGANTLYKVICIGTNVLYVEGADTEDEADKEAKRQLNRNVTCMGKPDTILTVLIFSKGRMIKGIEASKNQQDTKRVSNYPPKL